MSDSDLKQGQFTRIQNKLLETLALARLTACEYRCLMFLLRKTDGWHKREETISLAEWALGMGMDPQQRHNVPRTLRGLVAKQVIYAKANGSKRPITWGINNNIEEWDKSLFIECHAGRRGVAVLTDEYTAVLADDNTSVLMDDNSTVLTDNNSSVLTDDNTAVLADDNTSVLTGDNSTVLTVDNTSVLTHDNTTVITDDYALYKRKNKERSKEKSASHPALQENARTPQQPFFGAICEALGWDSKTMIGKVCLAPIVRARAVPASVHFTAEREKQGLYSRLRGQVWYRPGWATQQREIHPYHFWVLRWRGEYGTILTRLDVGHASLFSGPVPGTSGPGGLRQKHFATECLVNHHPNRPPNHWQVTSYPSAPVLPFLLNFALHFCNMSKEILMRQNFTRRDFLRGTTLLGAGALTGSLLAACAAPTTTTAPVAESGGGEAEAITIEWWTINLKNTFGEIMQGYIDSYQAEHANVTIDWVDVPGNEVAQKYATALSGGNAPDAANIYQMARFIELGAVLALDDYVAKEDQEAFGTFWEAGAIGGNHYAIPWYTSFARPVVVNGVLAKAAGVDLDNPPRTWQEIFEVGRTAKDVWGPGVFPWVDCWTSRSWAFEEGLDLLNEDFTAAAVNTPEWEAHINTILGLHEDGLLGLDAYACPDVRVSIDWFWQGIGAFSNSGTYILNRTENEVLEAGEYDVIPTAVGSANRIAADPQIFVIAKNSEHPDVATDFIMSIVRTENFIPFAKAVAIAPAYLPALQDPFFTEPPAEEAETYQAALIRKAVEIGIADMQSVAMPPLSKPVSYWTTVYEEVWQQVANEELALVEGTLPTAEFLAVWEERINAAIAAAPAATA